MIELRICLKNIGMIVWMHTGTQESGNAHERQVEYRQRQPFGSLEVV
ncbi:MAG TPA: hypothetical protein VHW45_14290 [Candidatus Sulfotelmatobacter sp.]|jgi:hypothetical protein|nr:hypothetical protein [Candidatus Sulfotelmatobacter sp.]